MDERTACAQLKRRFEAAGFRIAENQLFDEDGVRFEIDGLDAGSWFSPAFAGELRAPLLRRQRLDRTGGRADDQRIVVPALRRPQRPDSAALEVGHCLLTLSHENRQE